VKDGANSLRDLTRDLGVGTCCGKCLPEAKTALSCALKTCGSARPSLFSRAVTEFAV
jgi:bacterioferritin-associated ferredoxin